MRSRYNRRNNRKMRHYQGAAANQTLTPLEKAFFIPLENQGVKCFSMHFWNKGIWLMAITPMLPRETPGPTEVGCWISLN